MKSVLQAAVVLGLIGAILAGCVAYPHPKMPKITGRHHTMS